MWVGPYFLVLKVRCGTKEKSWQSGGLIGLVTGCPGVEPAATGMQLAGEGKLRIPRFASARGQIDPAGRATWIRLGRCV